MTQMNLMPEVLRVLDDVLGLQGRSASFNRETPLLCAIPELDSMGVVSLIARLEEQFDISVDDDDIDGETFATVGTLVAFIDGKVCA